MNFISGAVTFLLAFAKEMFLKAKLGKGKCNTILLIHITGVDLRNSGLVMDKLSVISVENTHSTILVSNELWMIHSLLQNSETAEKLRYIHNLILTVIIIFRSIKSILVLDTHMTSLI